jgi:YD repeat-containing protein
MAVGIHPADRWWDWTGGGWMVGENPVLLFDSSYPSHVGQNPTTTYLVLDAHRSIPFQQVNLAVGTGNQPRVGYEAPPRFRARMSHNGTWDTRPHPMFPGVALEEYAWDEFPTEVKVSLYDGMVTYTFAIIPLDVPPIMNYAAADGNVTVRRSVHERPIYAQTDLTNGLQSHTQGLPFIGICVRIEDRNGHRAEIVHAPAKRHSIDQSSTTTEHECLEQCLRRGQISHIKLQTPKGNGEFKTEWTLLYKHRYIDGTSKPPVGEGSLPLAQQLMKSAYGYSVIDSIYAMRGKVEEFKDGTSPGNPNPVPPGPVWEATSSAALPDPSADQDVSWSAGSMPPGIQSLQQWSYKVQYHYEKTDTELRSPPVLLWTEVLSRRETTDEENSPAPVVGSATSRSTIYRYTNIESLTYRDIVPWLERIYTDEDYHNLRRRAAEGAVSGPGMLPIPALPGELSTYINACDTIEKFAMDDTGDSQSTDRDLSGTARKALNEYARLDLSALATQQSLTSSWASLTQGPDGVALNSTYLGLPTARSGGELDPATVSVASVRDASGTMRHHRIYRILVANQGDFDESYQLGGGGSAIANAISKGASPHSLYLHPYAWATFPRGTGYPFANPDSPSLTEPRWVSIIDEFDSWEAARLKTFDPNATVAGTSYSTTGSLTAPGQLSRRVVKLNAAGYTLSDKTWEFTPLGTTKSGSGLGESYEYKSIQQLLSTETFNALMAEVEDDENRPTLKAQFTQLLQQPVLVERRSVGWSVAENSSTQNTQGLIHFYEYRWFDEPQGGLKPPLSTRLQMVAEGVQRGTGGGDQATQNPPPLDPMRPPTGPMRLYTRQHFVDPLKPTDRLGSIEFLDPARASTLFTSLGAAVTAAAQFPLAYALNRTEVFRDLGARPDLPVSEAPVAYTLSIGPARIVRPGGVPMHPVQMSVFDPTTGAQTFTGVGLRTVLDLGSLSDVDDESAFGGSLADGASWALTYTKTEDGRTVYTVADCVPGTSVPSPFQNSGGVVGSISDYIVPPIEASVPTGLRARVSTTVPLNYVTHTLYDGGEASDIYFPNKRRWARRTVSLDHDSINTNDFEEPTADSNAWTETPAGQKPRIRVYIFNDLEYSDNAWVARGQGEVRDYESVDPYAAPSRVRKVEFIKQDAGQSQWTDAVVPFDFLNGASQQNQVWFRPIAEKKFLPDQYGRMTAAELFERNVDGVSMPVGTKQFNDLGEVYREREMDGTITRTIKNSLGQATRRYVGTIDDTWLSADGGVIPLAQGNNLVLTELTQWGSGVNDAWMPVEQRRYLKNPEHADTPYEDPPTRSQDVDAATTVTSYDWRMRPVRVDRFSRGSSQVRLSTDLTYLDHAGRAVMTATFGANPVTQTLSLGGLDPTQLAPGSPLPDPSGIIGLQSASAPLLSLIHNTYGPDGNLTERRIYDLKSPSASNFQIEYQYTGLDGQPAFSHRPGDAAQITILDGIGRVARTSTVLARPNSESPTDYSFEIERSDNTYDADSNLILATRWERVKNAEAAQSTGSGSSNLDASNAVASLTVSWYDVNKRLVATATPGTSSPDDTFSMPLAAEIVRPTWYSEINRPSINPGDASVSRQGVPATVPLTINRYDRNGRLEYTYAQTTTPSQSSGDPEIKAGGLVTHMEYTGIGNLARRTENAFATDVTQQRITEYQYRYGRLAGITARNGASSLRQQVTTTDFGATPNLDYGAEVVGVSGFDQTVLSRHGTPVKFMRLPKPGRGEAAEGPAFTFRYDFQGRIAERVDARGVSFRYFYDDLDRLSSIRVGTYANGQFIQGYPESMVFANAPGAPSDRIQQVDYAYAADQKSVTITALTATGIVAQTQLEYDANGSLERDAQAHGVPVTNDSPATTYAWDRTNHAEGLTGRTRLASMLYPILGEQTRRSVGFNYGTQSLTSDQLSRIRRISTQRSDSPASTLAAFDYAGVSRRAMMHLAPAEVATQLAPWDPSHPWLGRIVVDHAQSTDGNLKGYTALGRIRELSFERPAGSNADLLRLSYTYDIGGSRISARRWPSPSDQSSTPNATRVENQFNSHDIFSRLTGSALRDDIENDQDPDGTLLRSDTWTLDALGNWEQRLIDPSDLPGDEYTQLRTTDNRNQIVGVSQIPDQPSSSPDAFAYDAAGNLIFDGTYFYQYDAWNRIVQINRAQYDSANRPTGPPDTPGETDPFLLIGPLVKHFTYDGLGRLIRTQSPIPDPQTSTTLNTTLPLRSERHYYDGVRRISTLTIDPLIPIVYGGGEGPGEEEPTPIGGGGLDPQGLPLEGEAQQQRQLGDGDTPGEDPPFELPEALVTLREFVWGPGDGHAGVDELLVQFDPQRRPIYIAQDASGDVVAAFDLLGPPARPADADPELPANLFIARRVWQATYDPYGQVLSARIEHPHDPLWTGHKGLFVERLDAGVMDGLPSLPTGAGQGSGLDLPRLTPGSTLLAHARNRWLHTSLGIWTSTDPNASGQANVELDGRLGSASPQLVLQVDLAKAFTDGSNLSLTYIGNPVDNRDPLGLFVGLFAPTSTLDIYSDYNDEALEGGMSAHEALDGMLTSYSEGQLEAIDFLEDVNLRKVDDILFTAGSVSGWKAGQAFVRHNHHIIPKFMEGVDNMANRLELPAREHEKFHRVLEQQFRRVGLNPPNSQGDLNWRKRFANNLVEPREAGQVRRAVIDACAEFDGLTNGKYALRAKAVSNFNAGLASRVFRQLRRAAF